MSSPAPGVPVCYRHAGRESHIRCQRCERPICPECMRDAAVGFQCPSCIKEGARSTRQAVGAYGGRRSDDPMLTSYALMVVNVAVWVGVVVTGWGGSRLIDLLGLRPDGLCIGGGAAYEASSSGDCPGLTYLPGVVDGAYWQLVTNVFLHQQVWHVAANMFALYLLGPQVEQALGRSRFLAVYALAGLTGSATVYWLGPQYGVTLGASGAIFGLFGALGVISIRARRDLRGLGVLLAINLVITFYYPGLSWQGHLGGLVGGALVTAILVYAPRGSRRATVQWLGLFGVAALIVLAIVLRSAALT